MSDVNRDEPVVRGPKPSAPPASSQTGPGKRPGRPGPRRRPRTAAAQAATKKKHTKRIAVIAGTAALTTAVSGIVGGLVSPERVQSVLGLSDEPTTATDPSSDSPAPSSPESSPSDEGPEAVEYKRFQDSTGAIALDVPAEWATAPTRFEGIEGVDSPGTAVRAAPDPMQTRFVSSEMIWVAASSEAFNDLNLDDYDDMGVPVLLAQRREAAASYLVPAGCVPTPKGVPDLGDRWIGAARAWQDCSSIPGWRAIEIEMISAARDAYVFVQIGLAPDTPDEVAQRVVDSLTVLAPSLPVE